jgi:hypothetical protein
MRGGVLVTTQQDIFKGGTFRGGALFIFSDLERNNFCATV